MTSRIIKNNIIVKRVSLKNIKFSEALSEETNAFVADVYLDNVKFGYAKNTGHGGCTDITHYPNKKELFNEAEAYCKSLPQIDYDTFKVDSNLENVVDTIFEDWLELKDLKKHMTKAIVFKKGGKIMKIDFKVTIKSILEIPNNKGLDALQRKVDELKKEEDVKILNTNLKGIKI